MPGLPPTWAIVIAILTLLFGGTGGIIWSLRRERREARLEPAETEKRRLENQKASEEIADMLRDAQKEAMDEMRKLLIQARDEAHAAREESRELRRQLEEIRSGQATFRTRVEELLKAHGIAIPDWWHTS